MGLDQYAYTTTREDAVGAFANTEDHEGTDTLIHTWRKHPDLHGWMERLYEAKGGAGVQIDTDADGVQHQCMGDEFNAGQAVALDAGDLDKLEEAVRANALPTTRGFFFGESVPEDKASDLVFLKKAREALEKGLRVYYTSWW